MSRLEVQADLLGIPIPDAQPTGILSHYVEQLVQHAPDGCADRVVLRTAQCQFFAPVNGDAVLRAASAASLHAAAAPLAEMYHVETARAGRAVRQQLIEAAEAAQAEHAEQEMLAEEAQAALEEAVQVEHAAQLWRGVIQAAEEELAALELPAGGWQVSGFMHHQVIIDQFLHFGCLGDMPSFPACQDQHDMMKMPTAPAQQQTCTLLTAQFVVIVDKATLRHQHGPEADIVQQPGPADQTDPQQPGPADQIVAQQPGRAARIIGMLRRLMQRGAEPAAQQPMHVDEDHDEADDHNAAIVQAFALVLFVCVLYPRVRRFCVGSRIRPTEQATAPATPYAAV